MRVAVASDHAGFCQKSQVVNHIQSLGHEAVDLGPTTDDRVDYPTSRTRWPGGSPRASTTAAC